MESSTRCTLLLIGLLFVAAAPARAQQADSATMSMVVLPATRTPVYVWPIMRGCSPDAEVTAAVVKLLASDLGLEVHRLAIPSDPRHLGCVGAECAELLVSDGCAPRTGLLIGGEIDEAPCDRSDLSLLDCRGQLLSRLRLFRVDLEQGRATHSDYRYGLCQDGRCEGEGAAIAERAAQLAGQLLAAGALTSAAPPRATPASEELCNRPASVAAVTSPVATPAPAAEATSQVMLFAYYSQYRHLDRPRDQAEREAQARAAHFVDGVTLPSSPLTLTKPVNTKYTLLPGEELIGNFARATALHGYLINPPPSPEFAPVHKLPLEGRRLTILVFDAETHGLALFLIEPNRALRQLVAPDACQAGSGESQACVAAALQTVLAAIPATPAIASQPTVLTAPQRPLGCLPYRQRSCAPCSPPPLVVAPLALPPPLLVDVAEPPPRKRMSERLLYAAMGLSVVTAGALTLVDSIVSPTILTAEDGSSATISGLLRPAVWTAWGLTLALAVPTVVAISEGGKSAPRPIARRPTAPPPSPPPSLCPIRETHL